MLLTAIQYAATAQPNCFTIVQHSAECVQHLVQSRTRPIHNFLEETHYVDLINWQTSAYGVSEALKQDVHTSGPVSPLDPLDPGGPIGPGCPMYPSLPGGPIGPGGPYKKLIGHFNTLYVAYKRLIIY